MSYNMQRRDAPLATAVAQQILDADTISGPCATLGPTV
jgi:hypothetical protein